MKGSEVALLMRLDWCSDATWLVIAGRVSIDTSDLHGWARVPGVV